MKILLFGGSGCLGSELIKLDSTIIAPSHTECDIIDYKAVCKLLHSERPDIVINSAAVLESGNFENSKNSGINTNIIGAANIATACNEILCRLVYISTDYIYKGDRGGYRESDEIYPANKYAWSKLGGECSAVLVDNHLIVRTSFGATPFKHKQAFHDKWSSKDYVDIIAPMIYDATISKCIGILNVGTERKTIYSHAVERSIVEKASRLDCVNISPYDTSLNLQKLESLCLKRQ